MERIIKKNARLTLLENAPPRKRVAAYAKVSSDKDAMINSLSAQVSYYSTIIQRRADWVFAGIYAEDFMSGTKGDRPEFGRMLEDCRAGKIDMVITKSIYRFARNTVTMLETVRELKLLGVDVYFENERIHSMSGDGEVMLTILASYAQEERFKDTTFNTRQYATQNRVYFHRCCQVLQTHKRFPLYIQNPKGCYFL